MTAILALARWTPRFAARSFAELRMLKVGAETSVGRLAGAVAGEMLKDQQVAMDACGPKAQLTALKAVTQASTYLNLERPGMQVAVEPWPERIAGHDQQPETSAIRLHLTLVPEFLPKEADVRMARETNPGEAAKEVAKFIRAKGAVTLAGMGQEPMSRALKAMMMARAMLGDDALGKGLVAAPSRQKSGEFYRMVLHCQLAPSTRT
ncbi:unnamed protein product [Effrenium voratum]|nr:unnamed protein product [Effrenium voratum]